MREQLAVGSGLLFNQPLINGAASAIGHAKTGIAIGSLSGAAQANATAAWIGFGSMKIGMFIMNALPLVGVAVLLDAISGEEYGQLVDWYEESWKRYEDNSELQELKKHVQPNKNYQLRAKKQPWTLQQQEQLFQCLEVENELYLLKKKMGLI